MPGATAPWLADLEDDWVQPAYTAPLAIKSSSPSLYEPCPASSKNKSRIPRRSSGASSIVTEKQNGGSTKSETTRRSALQELNGSAANSLRQQPRTLEDNGLRSASGASASSVVRYETIERRAKSSSPAKKDATMEWKKRLVDGAVGYGDQTDLFGPSGLENIFQSPSKPATRPTTRSGNPTKLFQQTQIMPSSPPPWPSSIDFSVRSEVNDQTDDLPHVRQTIEEEHEDSLQQAEQYDKATILDEQADNDAGSVASRKTVAGNRNMEGTSVGMRKISEQVRSDSSGFSPVFISKHTTINGEVNYAPMDSHMAKLMQRVSLDAAQQSQTPEHSVASSEPEIEAQDLSFNNDQDVGEESLPNVPEVSLPEDLPTGTPPITRLGSFVTTRRGGLSDYGSFKTRPLSPAQTASRMASVTIQPGTYRNPRDTRQDDAHEEEVTHPVVPVATPQPTTPIANVDSSNLLSPPKTRHSGSPLKLFGNYDTFTNKKLLRRMSQLENLEDNEKPVVRADQVREELSAIEQSQCAVDDVVDLTYQDEHLDLPKHAHSHAASKLSSFGEGELDDYDFEADLSFPSDEGDLLDERSAEGSPPPDIQPPGAKVPFHFTLDEAQEIEESSRLKRKLSNRSTMRSSETDVTVKNDHIGTIGAIPDSIIEGKRSRNSPIKAPTPKRRRTLHVLELEHDRRTSNALADDFSQTGTIRPRNPTPSQQREAIQAEINDATNEFLASSPRLQAIQDRIEDSELPGSFNLAAQAKAVASEVAAFTLNRAKDMIEGERKRSITTQDFLDEAMHIMSLIRARGRPPSGLGNLEESDEVGPGGQHLRPHDIEHSSSVLRISRPPSREGTNSGWRSRDQLHPDAQMARQLEKYQEAGEIQLIDATLQSLRLGDRTSPERGSQTTHKPADVDVRIHAPRADTQHSRQASDVQDDEQIDSFKTNQSSDFSTGRTIGTNSTRKSDNVATLAPETVAHLIPEEVAGMAYDRTQGRWVKLKGAKVQERNTPLSPIAASNITSDDDPFGNIPDLTVDDAEMQQLRHSQTAQAQNQSRHQQSVQMPTHVRTESLESVISKPATRHDRGFNMFTSSTAPSKYSAFASSRPQVETRATSWGSEHLASKPKDEYVRTSSGQRALSDPFDLAEEVAREEAKEDQALEENISDEESLVVSESETEELPIPLPRVAASDSHPGDVFRSNDRQVSLRMSTLQRAMDRGRFAKYTEQSEMSIIAELPDKRLMSVSVSVSRPPVVSASQSQEVVMRQYSPAKSAVLLSDLPDFTVHEADEARPSEQALAQRIAQNAMDDAGDRYALAVQNIVKTLTDVALEEPFWEDIRKLDLGSRDLGSLYGLDELCVRVQELDVNSNALSQLEGAPSSLRWLDASCNSLDSLTAWGHLMNLQYLDISDNQIDYLDGLENLVHLRELRADNNKISLLYGILDLDGLIKLSARGNDIGFVDFEHSQLKRLEELDLGDNHITQVSNIHCLPSLTSLVLDGNILQSLDLHAPEGQAKSKIETLSLSSNLLETLDVTACPSLRSLDLDQNRLQHISGLDCLHNLDILSLRKQDLHASAQTSLATSIFQQTLHARTLRLSYNAISALQLPHTYHSIQHLELTSCGLAEIPSDFGLRFPNLHYLNLNFNAIKDPRPLLNITRLEHLHLAGNRIARLRKSVATLAKLGCLRVLDVRDNPFTHGFYAPLGATGTTASSAATSVQTVALKNSKLRRSAASRNIERQQTKRREACSLPSADAARDAEHLARLDEETRLRRRVYELLLANSCKGLKELDGLKFRRERAMIRDAVFERLVKLGIVRRSEQGGHAEVRAVEMGTE